MTGDVQFSFCSLVLFDTPDAFSVCVYACLFVCVFTCQEF